MDLVNRPPPGHPYMYEWNMLFSGFPEVYVTAVLLPGEKAIDILML